MVSGDDDDFFDAAIGEVLDISLNEAHATDEFKGFDIVARFSESAAEPGRENDGLFGCRHGVLDFSVLCGGEF